MKILLIILFLLVNSQNLFANPQICSWIMDEPFKEYQEEAKDQHAAFYVVVSDGECEYGMTIGEKSEEKAKNELLKIVKNGEKKIIFQESVNPLLLTTKLFGKMLPLLQMMKEKEYV